MERGIGPQPRRPETRLHKLKCFGRAGENGRKFRTFGEEQQKYKSADDNCYLKNSC